MEKKNRHSRRELEKMVAQENTGNRHPSHPLSKAAVWAIPVFWSLFQLWYASPLPFIFNVGVFNDTEARAIHLAFAIFLAFMSFPMFKKHKHHVPWYDVVFGLLGAASAGYIFLFYTSLADRAGAPTAIDLSIAVMGMLLLLEATRRALGPPLMIVASIFLFYTFAGPYMPDLIAHKGASLQKTMSHQWLTTEGVFGVALGVSTGFVFLFVLFGALLEKAGAGNYFVKVAFSLLGHMRGGPAKAAVVSSGLSGLISGSSIANVVTTGTFTIPLMKRVGFPASKAAAVEVAASTNGQLTPPVMGAAAFLMVEYVGIPYIEVIKHAILPALISYIALIYIVHLEALKAGIEGLPRKHKPTMAQRLVGFLTLFFGAGALTAAVYFGLGWIKDLGQATLPVIGSGVVLTYIYLVKLAAKVSELTEDDPQSQPELPDFKPTVQSGLYFLLPIAVLVWCLTVERFSPGLSAFWATIFMIFIVLTHRPLLALFREGNVKNAVMSGFIDLWEGLGAGARNMIGIGVATAAAGIVVGSVTLTGVGLVMTEIVEVISGGNLLLILFFTAIISLILGMGLPTTANYIVVSTLMAPVIVTLGAEHGLIVPLIAVHLFVFYFGILADDTPPVGLAAFAASAIARSDPIKTGVQGFTYDIRTAILPFMFIFNTELLLIGIESIPHLIVTIFGALSAMLVFSAATQGFWITKTRWWETIGLLLITFTLFRPGFWVDQFVPEYQNIPGIELVRSFEGDSVRLRIEGESLKGEPVEKTVLLNLGTEGSVEERLSKTGLILREDNDTLVVDGAVYGSQADKAGIDFGWQVKYLLQENERFPKQLMFFPAFLLLFVIYRQQKRRQ